MTASSIATIWTIFTAVLAARVAKMPHSKRPALKLGWKSDFRSEKDLAVRRDWGSVPLAGNRLVG
jgi:hypothetical protein